TFGVLAVACVVAAGAGGYFASRQNAVPTPAAASALATSAPGAGATTPDRPVEETEAVVGDAPPKAAASPERASAGVVTTSTNSRRAEPVRNTPTPAARSANTTARQNPPALERTWPTNTPSQAQTTSFPSAPAAITDNSTIAAPVEDRAPLESPRTPEPPQKVFDELVVSANSVIGLETENRISSETARIEDRVEAKVTRDVKVGDTIAIPAGSRAIGSVIQVERGGKFKERARLGIRFTTLVLADGTRLPMSTDTIYREGDAPGNSSAAKIGGGAIGGAILGAILGGAKGAAIGATAGAGGGVAAVQVGDRQEVTLAAGSPMTVRLLTPLTVTVEQR
ncbi:MAG TPA: hypothetical protein VGJ39_11380, partial [Vicinamibacterales bacterium]